MKTSDKWVWVQWVLIGLLGLSFFAPRAPQLSWARPLGGLLAAAGALVVGVSAYSYHRVNRSLFHVSPEPDQSARLVDSGVYSFVRHPVYTGVIVGAFGVSLFSGSFWSVAAAAVLSVFYYLKSRYEESLLMKAFPDYKTYRERTGRFFPRIG